MKKLLLLAIAIVAAAVLSACGTGQSASPPSSGITVMPRDGAAVVSWTQESGVDYWLFFAASSGLTSQNVTQLPLGRILPSVNSPRVVTGLTNGTTYFFTINGRSNGGPGGADAPVVSATPRLAGLTWAVGTPLGTNDLRGVTFGAQFVAVGTSGSAYTSPDAVAWTALSSSLSTDLNAVVYNATPAFYVAAGAAGVILTSSDGQTWQAQTSGVATNLNGLSASGAAFVVAVGNAGTIVTSSNVTTWTARTSGTAQNLNAVANANGLIVAVGAGGTILTSADGTNWKTVSSGTSANLNGIAFGTVGTSATGLYVAVGAGGTVVTSPDGATWTVQPAIAPNALASVSFGTQFVAVGSAGSVFTSTDGVTWSARSSGITSDLKSVAAGRDAFSLGYSAVGAVGSNINAF